MANGALHPTVDELFQLLKRTSLPTVLVEGSDDIIFYRKIEEDLSHLGLDVLPAGNKDSVLRLRQMLSGASNVTFAFVVDKDLWVHTPHTDHFDNNLVQTNGYSIENDLFIDGELEDFMGPEEMALFNVDIQKFLDWYALVVSRVLRGKSGSFRTHPNKVLDDESFYIEESSLLEGETYPNTLRQELGGDFRRLVRGKSLMAILHRQLSRKGRDVKFSTRQLITIGGSRRGENFNRLKECIAEIMER
ncbi:DUF4435 domain-containing protein [Tritonibacter scottomollicae]|uniref:DUF4435 domain-containing protein n=1 Tax=Tritonibacter scottomollicae TaxID=483013 RepID=A0ABZ0HLI5_TRISK|nr:DUF4435 domain-containing protein [Tritonibacter scottomollicae]WOI35025.1 DUF4435 domain-containing protein [Tritonibacter scottomollicae]